ncbi:hypothetical protein [Dickeya zeae]|jgi:hypothetical protein|uniref:hypothetical protein n=1 Tax=Dickeya zeae TaxID=204042 RepID=UPI000C9BAEB4|nr:hypothetical protein [Dickeya zeae]AUQ27203.1 hypothetical protein C1O30_20105 [Dickeya zeae]UJR60259.1 hypothetical protein HJ580_19885 [Dickeya zeae]UJR63909.1 hypothetical protein HJ586_17840 [Dickeya zeae]
MGAYFGIGYRASSNNYDERKLSVVLNRQASDVLVALFDEVLKENYPVIYDKIMEVQVLDQINFYDLNESEFNEILNVIRSYLATRKEKNEGILYQKRIWEEEIEPLAQQDDRYQQ